MSVGLKIPNINESVVSSFSKAIENMDRLGSFADLQNNIDKGVGANFEKLTELGNDIAPISSNFYSESGKFIGTPTSLGWGQLWAKPYESHKSNLEGATHR